MIAEKTADAIKGRKLAPFEPPTRVATGYYSQPGKMTSSPAQYYRSSTAAKPQVQYPPPLGQVYPEHQDHLRRSLMEVRNGSSHFGQPDISNRQFLSGSRYGASAVADTLIKVISPVR